MLKLVKKKKFSDRSSNNFWSALSISILIFSLPLKTSLGHSTYIVHIYAPSSWRLDSKLMGCKNSRIQQFITLAVSHTHTHFYTRTRMQIHTHTQIKCAQRIWSSCLSPHTHTLRHPYASVETPICICWDTHASVNRLRLAVVCCRILMRPTHNTYTHNDIAAPPPLLL